MLALTLKTSKRAVFGGIILIVALAAGASLLFFGQDGARETGSKELAEIPKELLTVRNNDDRIEFIGHFGWEVKDEPTDIVEVVIPPKFDEVYENYNNIQKHQGFDLEKQQGKRVKRYSYIVTNYPDYPDEVKINLLVLGTKVVGGDVCSTSLDGFMHGFSGKP